MGNIVILDDNINTRKVLEEILKDDGHKVIGCFRDPNSTINLIRINHPDLVVLDYSLNYYQNGQEITGLDVLKTIHSIDKKIRVLFLSAHAKKDIIKQVIQEGASDFMVKPFDSQELLCRVRRCFPLNDDPLMDSNIHNDESFFSSFNSKDVISMNSNASF